MGLEPTISGTTIRRANQLHHTHHTEPGGIRTLDLRLRRPLLYPAELQTHSSLNENLSFSNEKRVMGIEPTYPAWKAGVLPLNYTRKVGVTGFEPATSWSQTRRSSQAEPHPDISFFPRPCGFVFLSYLPQRQDILYGMFLRKSTVFLKFFYFFATVFLPVFRKKSVQIVSFVLVF